MTFKEFIMQETMTSTSCIAGFSRITLPMVKRMYPPTIAFDNESDWEGGKKSKKKVIRQPQVKD